MVLQSFFLPLLHAPLHKVPSNFSSLAARGTQSRSSFLLVALSKFSTSSLPPPTAQALYNYQPRRRNVISCILYFHVSILHNQCHWQALVEALCMCWRSQTYILFFSPLCVILHYCRWVNINFKGTTEVGNVSCRFIIVVQSGDEACEPKKLGHFNICSDWVCTRKLCWLILHWAMCK